MTLPHVKKKRQAQRDANNEAGSDWQPKISHTDARTLGENKNPEDQCRDEDIKSEKGSNAVREQLMKEKRKIQTMLPIPRNKLRVRQERANHAQNQINVP